MINRLTIGIPSYRRPRALRDTLRSIADTTPPDIQIKILVINDSGTKAHLSSYRKLLEESDIDASVRLLANSENEGYARSLLRLFAECTTDYLFLTADDDVLKLTHVDRLIYFLDSKKPSICSTQYLRQGRIYRGKEQSRKALPREFCRLNGHAPGVVYNVSAVRESLRSVSRLLAEGNVIANTYPQLLLTIDLMLRNNNCWFFADAFVEEGKAENSGIKDASGFHYSDLASRIQQLAALDALILQYPASPARDEMLESARKMWLRHCVKADPLLFSNIIAEHRSGWRTQMAKLLKRTLKPVIKSLNRMREV